MQKDNRNPTLKNKGKNFEEQFKWYAFIMNMYGRTSCYKVLNNFKKS